MKKQIGDYKFLAGSTRIGGTLWEGPDHLLYLERPGFALAFSEISKRLDYKNIQCISYAPTRTGWWTTAWISTVLIGAAFGGFFTEAFSGRVTFWGVAGLSGLGLLIHLLKGPTSLCKVQTAVQVLQLKPLRRLRPTQRFVQRLTELCHRHQGEASLEVVAPPPLGLSTAPDLAGFHSRVSIVGIIRTGLLLLLLAGVLLLIRPFAPHPAVLAVTTVAEIAAGILLLSGLVRNWRAHLPRLLKGTLCGANLHFLLTLLAGFSFWVYGMFTVAQSNASQGKIAFANQEWEAFRWLAQAGFAELGWATWLLVGIGGVNLILSLLGLPIAWRLEASTASAPPALSKPPRNSTSDTAAPYEE
jgi:hypothetical protein